MNISLDNEQQVESVVLLERSIGRDTDYGEKTDPNDHP